MDWDELFIGILVVVVVLVVIGALFVFLPIQMYHSSFETVIKGSFNGEYVVTGEKIDRDLKLIYAKTNNDKEVIIKFVDKSNTPVKIAPGYSAIIKVNNEHLVGVIEIPKENEVPKEVLDGQ